jgi:hypothetical protein
MYFACDPSFRASFPGLIKIDVKQRQDLWGGRAAAAGDIESQDKARLDKPY